MACACPKLIEFQIAARFSSAFKAMPPGMPGIGMPLNMMNFHRSYAYTNVQNWEGCSIKSTVPNTKKNQRGLKIFKTIL